MQPPVNLPTIFRITCMPYPRAHHMYHKDPAIVEYLSPNGFFNDREAESCSIAVCYSDLLDLTANKDAQYGQNMTEDTPFFQLVPIMDAISILNSPTFYNSSPPSVSPCSNHRSHNFLRLDLEHISARVLTNCRRRHVQIPYSDTGFNPQRKFLSL